MDRHQRPAAFINGNHDVLSVVLLKPEGWLYAWLHGRIEARPYSFSVLAPVPDFGALKQDVQTLANLAL